jgi:hypothetical protein
MLRGFMRGVPGTTMPQGRVEMVLGDRQDHIFAIGLIVLCVADGAALFGIDLLIVGAIARDDGAFEEGSKRDIAAVRSETEDDPALVIQRSCRGEGSFVGGRQIVGGLQIGYPEGIVAPDLEKADGERHIEGQTAS